MGVLGEAVMSEPTPQQLAESYKYRKWQRKRAVLEARQNEERANINKSLQKYEAFHNAELQQRKTQPTDAEQFAIWDEAGRTRNKKNIVRFVLFVLVMTLCILFILSSSGLVIFY